MRIANILRKVLRRLVPNNSVEKALGVDICESGVMQNAIELWHNMYKNEPPWRGGKDNVIPLNLPSAISEEFARLILTEFSMEVTGSPMAAFINEQLKDQLTDLNKFVEMYCEGGAIAVKPFVTNIDENGRPTAIELDFVKAVDFFPCAFNNKGEITAAVFVEGKKIGDYLYTRLEYHVKAGGYVSKEKLDAKITELDGVKQQLLDANTTIQSYKDMDIDGIKQSAKDWETKYTQETQKLTAQLAAQERTHALDMFMGGYKFSSKPAENGVRAEFEKKNFTLEDGKFLGGDEFMKSLMENDDYKGAFVIEDDNDPEDDSHEDEEGKPFFARGVGGTGGAGGEGVKGKEAPFNPFGFNLIRQPDKN